MSEMERDLIVERTTAGLLRAIAEGKTLGRKPKTTKEDRKVIATAFRDGTTVSELARQFRISRATVYEVLKKENVCV